MSKFCDLYRRSSHAVLYPLLHGVFCRPMSKPATKSIDVSLIKCLVHERDFKSSKFTVCMTGFGYYYFMSCMIRSFRGCSTQERRKWGWDFLGGEFG